MSGKNLYLDKALANDSDEVRNGRGVNIIPPPERESLWRAYLEKFKDPIIIVLLVVFVLSIGVSCYEVFFLGMSKTILLEPTGVLISLLLATGVGFIFEVKAGKEFDLLNKVKDSRPVKVIRRMSAGERPRLMHIKKQDVVVGDIVRLEGGDEVPADGELLHCISLRVDESNFTGETYTTKTTKREEFRSDATYPSNVLLRGSIIIEGNAIYCVKAVGIDTEEGKGVMKSSEGSDVETPLNQQLAQLGKWISTASFILATLIVIGRLAYYFITGAGEADQTVGSEFLKLLQFTLASVMIAVTLIVVAVPEGLPMSVTVSLALSMRRMLRENNLVRKLHACETMGAATVICTDKTGTLTQNKMTVIENDIYGNEQELLFMNVAVNSTAELSKDENGAVQRLGNPTECALLEWLSRGFKKEYQYYRNTLSVEEQKPFSTETKYMETLVEGDDKRQIRLVKGAPEIVLQMCGSVADGVEPTHIEQVLRNYQGRAMRTLGFAYQRIGIDKELVFQGVVGIADPIRPDVREAIETCMNRAHVRVIIVTGDTPGTANEIGRQIGLIRSVEDERRTITGPDFAAMGDDEALKLVKDPSFKIIARARPEDKARLVTLLQRNNEVVAVTGDGTNDAPALSKAQVGLSMGDGTSRAKEASDITIIDNSFASINKAIMWGRSLYLNIRRFIIFQMTINVCACLIVLLGAFIGVDSPLTVTQMLWVNLIMDTFAAMALSSLPADKKVLNERPRSPKSHIVDRGMLRLILGVGLIFFVAMAALWQLLWHVDGEMITVSSLFSGDNLRLLWDGLFDMSKNKAHVAGHEMAIFFSIFVMLQFWNLFNAKYFRTERSLIQDAIDLFRNRRAVVESHSAGFWLITLVILAGQILIVTFGGKMFGVEPLSFDDWCMIILYTSPVLILADIFRFIKNSINGR